MKGNKRGEINSQAAADNRGTVPRIDETITKIPNVNQQFPKITKLNSFHNQNQNLEFSVISTKLIRSEKQKLSRTFNTFQKLPRFPSYILTYKEAAIFIFLEFFALLFSLIFQNVPPLKSLP